MTKSARWIMLISLCLLCAFVRVAGGAAAAAPPMVGVDTLLQSYLDLNSLPRLSDNVVSLASSHDRTGGNADFGHFLRREGDGAVLAEMDGPGAIVRLWTTDPEGQLKIYVDGSPAPILDVPFGDIAKGKSPFTTPLSGFSSGGDYTYLPIPYAHHCKVVVEHPGSLYYQVNSVKFPPHTAVRPFSLPLSPADQAAVEAINAAWSALAAPPANVPGLARPMTLTPGATETVAALKGPGTITHLHLALPDTGDRDLRRVILRAYFDGHQTPDVQAPVGDFFGNPVERKPFRSLLIGCGGDGTFAADFPMPFARGARFTLESREAKPARVVFRADFKPGPFHGNDTGYFHAWWRQEKTRPGEAHTWIKTVGRRGRLVGIAQSMAGTHGLGFLEGDDQFRTDAQAWQIAPLHPTTVLASWNGTGTEDFFNSGGYYDHGPNVLPMNGLLEKWSRGLIVTYRWFVNDSPTFQHSLDGQIEHGGVNDSEDEVYSSVTYWYSDGPVQAPPVTSFDDLASPETLVPQFFVPAAIEGETLKPAISGGVAERQWVGAGWSDENQLWWRGAAAGDTLTVSVTAPTAGKYELYGFLTKARDYGKVTFAVNGEPVGGVFDGYAPALTPPTPTDIGPVTLPAGASQLVVSLTGKNPAGVGTMFGLDCLVLNPPGSPAPAMLSQIR